MQVGAPACIMIGVLMLWLAMGSCLEESGDFWLCCCDVHRFGSLKAVGVQHSSVALVPSP